MAGPNDDLAALIRTIPDFPRAGIQFRDITTLLLDAKGFAATIERMAALVAEAPDLVAGIEARGFVIGHNLGETPHESSGVNSCAVGRVRRAERVAEGSALASLAFVEPRHVVGAVSAFVGGRDALAQSRGLHFASSKGHRAALHKVRVDAVGADRRAE